MNEQPYNCYNLVAHIFFYKFCIFTENVKKKKLYQNSGDLLTYCWTTCYIEVMFTYND